MWPVLMWPLLVVILCLTKYCQTIKEEQLLINKMPDVCILFIKSSDTDHY